MNSCQTYISFGLVVLLGVAFGGGLFYLHSSTFWDNDLEAPLPSTIWFFVCLLLTILIFGAAYYTAKAVAKALGFSTWAILVATPAIAMPALNLSTGFLFAYLNGVGNVYGFPLSRPNDLLADQILLSAVGAFVGLAVWLTSLLLAWVVGQFHPLSSSDGK